MRMSVRLLHRMVIVPVALLVMLPAVRVAHAQKLPVVSTVSTGPATGTLASLIAHPANIPSTLVPVPGKRGHYTIQGCVSMPRNSKPWTFTDDQLNLYGLPLPEWFPRGRQDPNWRKWVAKPVIHDCDVFASDTSYAPAAAVQTTQTTQTTHAAPAEHEAKAQTTQSNQYTNFFAGYIDDSFVADTFILEQGDFEVPQISDPPSVVVGDSLWSGLGGAANCHLVQSGVGSVMYDGSQSNKMFVENYGNNADCSPSQHDSHGDKALEDSSFPPAPHDHIYTLEGQKLISTNPDVYIGTMYVEDQTGTAHSMAMQFGPRGFEEQFSCVLERETTPLGLYLPQNDESVFNNCMGFDQYALNDQGEWYYLHAGPSNWTEYNYVMTDDGTRTGNVCADNSPFNGTGGFSVFIYLFCTSDGPKPDGNDPDPSPVFVVEP